VHRLFVAIRPPEPIRGLLIDAMDDGADFRWQEDEQLHLTLRFVGDVERPLANDLADALSRVRAAPFDARITGAGRFEQRNSGALWAGVEPRPPLAALAAKVERVCQSVGLEPERRAFFPHITLARWKGRRTREVHDFLDRTRGLSSEQFAVDRFILFESRLSRHGAHYEEVAAYPLTQAAKISNPKPRTRD
jgi:2'-5' RNA ligase